MPVRHITSKYKPIPAGVAVDANQAVVLLDQLHHWSCMRVVDTRYGGGHRVKLRHVGFIVSSARPSFVEAANAALCKLRRVESMRSRKGKRTP